MQHHPLLIVLLVLLSPLPCVHAKHLIVLSAPRATGYYESVYDKVIDFHIRYAEAILQHDDVLVLTDRDSYPLFQRRLPDEVLVKDALQEDIWMRDFTTINPATPVQLRYAAAAQGGSQAEADFVQKAFNRFLARRVPGLRYEEHREYILDGGNVVDNHKGRVVVTDKFLDDNRLGYSEGVRVLRELLRAKEVAIVPKDDPHLGHADGMMMWIDEDVLVVNKYNGSFRTSVLTELRSAFPSVRILEVPVQFDDHPYDPKFSSALGINVNSVMTDHFIYMPVFSAPNDAVVADVVRKNTKKTLITIDATAVARMGGSCRCLAWQTSGAVARTVRAALAPDTPANTPYDSAAGITAFAALVLTATLNAIL